MQKPVLLAMRLILSKKEMNVHKNVVKGTSKMTHFMFVLNVILLVINVLVLVIPNVLKTNVHLVTSNHFYLQPLVYLIVTPNSTIIIIYHPAITAQQVVQNAPPMRLILGALFVMLANIFLMENVMKPVLKTTTKLMVKL